MFIISSQETLQQNIFFYASMMFLDLLTEFQLNVNPQILHPHLQLNFYCRSVHIVYKEDIFLCIEV